MALIPMIQPPIMKLMTSEADRKIKMVQSRPVSKTEKVLFPIIVTIFVVLLLPSTAPLIGCLMLGNLFRECGCTDRLSDTVQNALMNIVTIFLSTSVGATMVASNFLKPETLKIILLGLVAFGISTVGGLIGGNIMCKLSGKKVNPLIGSAGVSAVPMAARVSQMVGQKANPANFLLMHSAVCCRPQRRPLFPRHSMCASARQGTLFIVAFNVIGSVFRGLGDSKCR